MCLCVKVLPLKFLHIADTHIGIENYGRIDPSTGLHTRLQDFVKCLRHAFQTALDEEVDAVLFAGDAYRSCDPTPTHQREFASAIRLLVEVGIPVVMVTGNHDSPVSFGKATSLDIFDTLRTAGVRVATRDELISLETKSGPLQVACLPWLNRSRLAAHDDYRALDQEQIVAALQDLGAEIIAGLAEQVDPEHASVLLGHVAAADAALSGTEQTALIGRDPVFLTGTLANAAFDYVALGHIHRFQDLNPGGSPPVVYAGSVERIDFGEESEAKGFCVVTISDSSEPETRREVEYRFVGTPARPFRTIRASIPDGADPTEVITQQIEEIDVADAVVRVQYELEGDDHPQLDLKAVSQALEDAFLVAGMVAKPKPQTHLRRADITPEAGLRDAVKAYVSNRPELEGIGEDLEKYALDLEAERTREG